MPPTVWIRLKISVVKRKSTWSIQLLKISVTTPRARSFGMIVNVMSRIEVTAWNSVTTMPTTMHVRSRGADTINAVSSVCLPM